MKILILKDILLGALQQAHKAVPNKTSLPVLTGILVKAMMDGMSFVGGNTDLYIQADLPPEDYKLQMPGAIVLPAKESVEIVKKMPNGYITIEVTSGLVVRFSIAKTSLQIVGMSADDYPALPSVPPKVDVMIHGRVFRSLIKRTIFAAADSNKDIPTINGVLVRSSDGRLSFTATNKIIAARAEEVSDIQLPDDFIISAKHLKEVLSLTDDTNPMTIISDGFKVIIRQGTTSIYAAVLNGKFPAIDNLFKNKGVVEAVYGTEDITQALERLRLTAGSIGGAGHVVKLNIQRHKMALTSRSDAGCGEDEVLPSSFSGEEITALFSATRLLDALQVIDSKEVRMRFCGSKAPCIISTSDRSDVYMVSPCNGG